MAFVGHLGDPTLLTGVVLASSVYNITGFSIVCGLAAGSETLCGQAFGARQHRVLGGVALRALAVCLAASLPVLLLWTRYAAPLLLLFGQPPAVVAVAALYLRRARPALLFSALGEVLKRYLLAQRVVVPGVAAMAATTALAPLYCYALVFHLDMGAGGAAAAFALSTATGALLLLGYVAWRDRAAAARGDRDATFVFASVREALCAAFSGWPAYLSYALPALAQMWAEWAFYEFAILIAGAGPRGEVNGGAAGLCFQVSALVFMSAMALGSSANTRVANELGAGRARAARRAACVAMLMTLAMQAAQVAAVCAWRRRLLSVFTNSAVVADAALAAFVPLAGSILSDAANCILSAVMRGSGRQALGAYINIAGYWLLGMPLALALGRRYEVWGLWLAIGLASTAVAAAQAAAIARFDWGAEVGRAADLSAAQAAQAAALQQGAGGGAGGLGVGAYSSLAPERQDVGADEEQEDGGAGARADQARRGGGGGGGGKRPPPPPRLPPLPPAAMQQQPSLERPLALRGASSALSLELSDSFSAAVAPFAPPVAARK